MKVTGTGQEEAWALPASFSGPRFEHQDSTTWPPLHNPSRYVHPAPNVPAAPLGNIHAERKWECPFPSPTAPKAAKATLTKPWPWMSSNLAPHPSTATLSWLTGFGFSLWPIYRVNIKFPGLITRDFLVYWRHRNLWLAFHFSHSALKPFNLRFRILKCCI